MQIPNRLIVKFFVQNPDDMAVEAFIPVFQTWIQERKVPGLLIDVADYKHVHHGPGIVLIGHDVDYAYDLREGKPGIQYTAKQSPTESLANYLTESLHRALSAAIILQEDEWLPNVDFNAVRIEFVDRLHYPNNADTVETLQTVLAETATTFYGDAADVEVIEQDSRENFSVRLTTPETIDGRALLEKFTQHVSEIAQ